MGHVRRAMSCLRVCHVVFLGVVWDLVVQFLFFLNPKFLETAFSVAVQPGLCGTWLEMLKTCFLS